jgi:hypothetical protein
VPDFGIGHRSAEAHTLANFDLIECHVAEGCGRHRVERFNAIFVRDCSSCAAFRQLMTLAKLFSRIAHRILSSQCISCGANHVNRWQASQRSTVVRAARQVVSEWSAFGRD